jgi:drug/metabolite transporter (DMT)-like permease
MNWSPGADPVGFAFVLITASAMLHAVTNVLLKASTDRQMTRALLGVTSAAVALPFLPITPWPTGEVWMWLAASAVLHFIYQFTLLEAYAVGDFSAVYPVARGSAPVLTACGTILIFGDHVPFWALVGIAMIGLAMGVIGLGAGRAGGKATLLALITGFMIAGYTLVDAKGMRAAENPLSFLVWEFLTDGMDMLIFVVLTRGFGVFAAARQELTKGLAAGLLSVIGYGAALFALRLGPLAEVAALRETSVIYGAILGVWLFKERLGPIRITAAIVIAAGAVIIRAA